jgi:hypothetical protein
MATEVIILLGLSIYLLWKNRTYKKLSEQCFDELVEEHNKYLQLKNAKFPAREYSDNEIWQIEKKLDGFILESFKNREPYESFIPFTKDELIETLKTRL